MNKINKRYNITFIILHYEKFSFKTGFGVLTNVSQNCAWHLEVPSSQIIQQIINKLSFDDINMLKRTSKYIFNICNQTNENIQNYIS